MPRLPEVSDFKALKDTLSATMSQRRSPPAIRVRGPSDNISGPELTSSGFNEC